MLMGLMVVGCGTFALCVLEPQLDFGRLLFEQISAYSTAGLSTGITAELCPASRVVLILTMFIGRVGAVTLLSLWVERPEPHRPLYRRSHYDWVNAKPQGNHRRGGFHIRP